MDIALLTGPAGHRAGPPQPAPGASPNADFNASLAQAAGAGRASASDARPGQTAPDDEPSAALAALTAALDDAPAAVRERLTAALDSGRLRHALPDLLDQAELADADLEALAAALESAMTARQAEAGAPERHAGLAPLAGALHRTLDPPPTAAPAAAGGGDGDAWATLHERLTLIEQAGRPAAAEQAGARPAGAALTPQHHALRQGNDDPRAAPALAPSRSAPQAGMEPSVASVIQRLAAAPQRAAQAAGPEPGAYGPLPGTPDGLSAAAGAATGGTPASAAPQPALTAPLTSPAWPQQLGQQLIRMSRAGGEQRVELQLHPAELGPLSVSLKLGDQGAQAQLLSAHAQVRQALEQAIPQLREALAEQGIQLGEATVGEQREDRRDSRDFEHAGRTPPLGDGDTPGDEAAAAADSVRELPVTGRVSVYA